MPCSDSGNKRATLVRAMKTRASSQQPIPKNEASSAPDPTGDVILLGLKA